MKATRKTWAKQTVIGLAALAVCIAGPGLAQADVGIPEHRIGNYFDGSLSASFADASNGAEAADATEDVIAQIDDADEGPVSSDAFANGAASDDHLVTFGPFGLYDNRQGLYIEGTIGPSFSSISALDTGFGLNFATGYKWDLLRFEGDLGLRYHNISGVSGDFTLFTAMFNTLIDFDILPVDGLDVYTGLGLGLGYADVSGSGIQDRSRTNLALQFMAGVSYAVLDNLDVVGGFRWVNARVPGGSTESFNTIEGGVRYSF